MKLGVLMLDTRFPRLPGDVGAPRSFEGGAWQPMYSVVLHAIPRDVVGGNSDIPVDVFISTAQRLVSQGARAITTSCGFLVLHQAALQAGVSVPVWSSALLDVPRLQRSGARVGILTIDRAALGPAHLAAAGIGADVPVQGVQPGCEFHAAILGNRKHMDAQQARADVVDAAQRLVHGHPGLTDIVLECTNMPPHADEVAAATGCRVHHLLTLLAREGERMKAQSS